MSRHGILSAIFAARPPKVELPRVPDFAVSGDPLENFMSALASYDGRALRFASREEAISWLTENVSNKEVKVFSALRDFKGNIDRSDLRDPHAAHEVAICVARGVLGVGETGSMWVTDESLGVPAAALLCTDLYLLLRSADILPGIHQAYRAISMRRLTYGSFFTGPSATADIEAVRVTGAQGPVSLTVLLY